MRLSFLFLLSGFAALSGCGSAHYEYPLYQPGSRAYGTFLPLRAAIVYPEEGRSAPDRDEDLEPIITSRCTELPTYISPRLEISRGLLEELRATRAFQNVHWSPESLADYDLVIRMKLVSGGKRFKSDTCPAMLGPSEWELAIFDQGGKELQRKTLVLAKTKLFSKSPVAAFRRDEQVFMKEAVSLIMPAAAQLAGAAANIQDSRALNYLAKRDPELGNMREQIAAGKADNKLSRAYLLRVGTLEAERISANNATEVLQEQYDRAWAGVQADFQSQLKELGENIHRMLTEKLSLLLNCVQAVQGLNAGGFRPQEMIDAASGARSEMLQVVSAPQDAHKFLGELPKSLLPGALPELASEAGLDAELVQTIQTAFAPGASGAGAAPPSPGEIISGQLSGCSKDTDCKGDRICVKRECIAP